jgi:hypothetical protein
MACSRLLVPNPKAAAEVLVEDTWLPVDDDNEYAPGPGEVAARLTWS